MEYKTFTASDEDFPAVNSYVEEWLDEHGCPMKTAMQLTIALEEIFINIAHYAYPHPPGQMDLGLECDNGTVKMRFVDSGTPFDPLAKPDPDVTLSAEERRIGGLGIFMVKKSMDDVIYEHKDGKNILTLIKNI